MERYIALYQQRARNYLTWLDAQSAVFWAEKAVALSIEHYNLSQPKDPIRPFTNGEFYFFIFFFVSVSSAFRKQRVKKQLELKKSSR